MGKRSMSVIGVVYCNLCPLKELCPYARDEDAYWWSRGNHAKDEQSREMFYSKSNYGQLKRATSLCPLRKVLE